MVRIIRDEFINVRQIRKIVCKLFDLEDKNSANRYKVMVYYPESGTPDVYHMSAREFDDFMFTMSKLQDVTLGYT